MSGQSAGATLGRLVRISPPPWRRLSGALALAVAASGATVGLLAGSGALVDKAAGRPGIGVIAGLLAVVEVVAFARAPLRYGERLVAHDAGFRTLARWRVWLFDRLEPLSPAGLTGWRSGDLARRAIADVDSLQDLYLRGLGPLVVAVVVGAAAICVEGFVVPVAAAILAGALLVAMIGAPALAWAGRPTEADRAEAGALAADIVDLTFGAAELLAFGRADAHLESIEARTGRIVQARQRAARATGAAGALVALCSAAAVTGTLAAAIAAVRGGHLEPIMLAVLPLTALGAFEVVPPLATAAAGLGEVVAAGRRLLELADRPAPVRDPAQPLAAPTPPIGITVEGARLRYEPDGPWALDGLDLTLAAGSATALVGPSGSGKTSLLHALQRFWALDAGTMTAGTTPLDAMDQREARALFAPVDHDAHLFAGTLRDNVAFARPDASEREINVALRAAQLEEWVMGLPLGLDTPVGERGSMLSGGQRQRVAVARALLAGRPVLLLDEPGAGLDDATATRLVDDAIHGAAGRTVVVVTHRRAEAERVDAVVEIDAGRVVARRSPIDQRKGSRDQTHEL